MSQRIYVQVSQARKANLLKVVWRSYTGRDFLPYFIDRGALSIAAEGVRANLDNVVQRALRDGCVDDCGEVLQALAQSGTNLRHNLFRRVEGDQDSAEVRQWLTDEVRDSYPIEFVVEDRIHIPWGLIYDDGGLEFRGAGNNLDIDNYRGFWALKYQTSTTYFRITPDRLKTDLNDDNVELISVVSSQVYRRVLQQISRENQLVSANIAEILNSKGRLAESTAGLVDHWEQSFGKAVFLYFYCHANGTTLQLSDSDRLKWPDLERRLQHSSREKIPRCLVILNGCSTAIGGRDGGFLEAVGSDGFYGFVGTESSVPDIFALRFGAELLQRILTSGETLSEIMSVMRRIHWPLSILYSINCYPELKVSPLKHIELPELPEENYSQQNLGTEGLQNGKLPKKGSG